MAFWCQEEEYLWWAGWSDVHAASRAEEVLSEGADEVVMDARVPQSVRMQVLGLLAFNDPASVKTLYGPDRACTPPKEESLYQVAIGSGMDAEEMEALLRRAVSQSRRRRRSLFS